jgi:hypothetical protein
MENNDHHGKDRLHSELPKHLALLRFPWPLGPLEPNQNRLTTHKHEESDNPLYCICEEVVVVMKCYASYVLL